jgi:uncharacterized protein YbjT (DUF2867 family)
LISVPKVRYFVGEILDENAECVRNLLNTRAKGVSMVDVRDIGEAAALELIRRERAPTPLPRETYALVGPDVLTGESLSALWSEVLDRKIRGAGDDLGPFETRLKTMLPAWHALDLRLMFGRYQSDGAAASSEDIARQGSDSSDN